MNTLSDTLNDFLVDIEKAIGNTLPEIGDYSPNQCRIELIEEYVERIKAELNVEKYLI